MSIDSENLVRPEPTEEADLQELNRQIEAMLAHGDRTAKLIGPHGDEVAVPACAFHALRVVVDGMAQGLTMMLIPQGQELTTQQAADILHVSRPHVVKLLEEGHIDFHSVGTHRRVKIEDVLAYRAQRNQRRREALADLVRLSEEAGHE